MKTIQEELGGVSQRRNGEMLAKSKPRNGTRKRKRISKIVKMRRMNPQAPFWDSKKLFGAFIRVTME
jgi:hypothetical protein